MKLKFLLAGMAISMFTITSCHKDEPASPPTNNPANSKRLVKVTKTEAGVATVFNLSYDSNNKLLSYRSADNSEYVIFTYDTQGNLTGIEDLEKDFKNIYEYTYTNNEPATGTFKSWQVVGGQPTQMIEDDLLTYTVNNNQVSKIKLEMLQTGDELNMQLTYTGGNLTRVMSEGQVTYTADFGFGTHRPAFPKVSKFVLDQAGFSLQFASNNDILSASYDFPGTSFDRQINTNYTYDSNGYVLTADDGTAQMVFEYQ
nr:hypothetical protein [uncultured bacterium]